MRKLPIKLTALMLSLLGCFVAFTACGGDDDDDDVPPIAEGTPGPTSITVQGFPVYKFSYDSYGRITRFSGAGELDPTDGLTIDFAYSPLSVRFSWDDEYTRFTDVTVNSAGYMTKAKVTDYYEGETESYWVTFAYDNAGHVTKINTDGEVTTFTWQNGNLTAMADDEGDSMRFDYSTLANKAKVVSPNWFMEYGVLMMAGILGEVPAYFPSTVVEDGYATYDLSYDLTSEGFIAKEYISNGNVTAEYVYNYGSRSLEAPVAAPAQKPLSLKKHSIFKRHNK